MDGGCGPGEGGRGNCFVSADARGKAHPSRPGRHTVLLVEGFEDRILDGGLR
jgi:hypothetical protein